MKVKKFTAILLSVVMLMSIFTAVPFSVGAEASDTATDLETQFYEYAGLSDYDKDFRSFEIIAETDDYILCTGGTNIATALVYSVVIGNYCFESRSQPSPYDLGVFIYKDGQFKTLEEAYNEGIINIDETVGYLNTYDGNLKFVIYDMLTAEIGTIDGYTLSYRGLPVDDSSTETVTLKNYYIEVKDVLPENSYTRSNDILGLYLTDSEGNETSLQDAWDSGMITNEADLKALLIGNISMVKYYSLSYNVGVTDDPELEAEFYEYAGLSADEATFYTAGVTEDYTICIGGSDIGTELAYPVVIEDYLFMSLTQISPYDLGVFIYKDGQFKTLEEAYVEGIVNIDEVVVYLRENAPRVPYKLSDMLTVEISTIDGYTLSYRGLPVENSGTETVTLKNYSIEVNNVLLQNSYSRSNNILGLYLIDSEGNETSLQDAWDSGMITDTEVLISLLKSTESSEQYYTITGEPATTEPDLETQFYEYAGLSDYDKEFVYFNVIAETDDYTICTGGTNIVTNLVYYVVIGNYCFYSYSQPAPYDLSIFIYKNGEFKTLEEAYNEGIIDIDEVMSYFSIGNHKIFNMLTAEIGTIDGYTLSYRGLPVEDSGTETVILKNYSIEVNNVLPENSYTRSNSILGLYLIDSEGNETSLQDAWNSGLITDEANLISLLKNAERAEQYYTVTENSDNATVDTVIQGTYSKTTKLKAGESTTLTVLSEYVDTYGEIKSYKVLNKKLAKVSAKGKVTGIKKGSTVVRVTFENGSKLDFPIKVTSNPKLNKLKKTLKEGETFKLKINGKVGKATFKSKNKRIAKVNAKGKVTAKKKGNVTVIVKANNMKLKCKITVK